MQNIWGAGKRNNKGYKESKHSHVSLLLLLLLLFWCNFSELFMNKYKSTFPLNQVWCTWHGAACVVCGLLWSENGSATDQMKIKHEAWNQISSRQTAPIQGGHCWCLNYSGSWFNSEDMRDTRNDWKGNISIMFRFSPFTDLISFTYFISIMTFKTKIILQLHKHCLKSLSLTSNLK